MKKVDLSKAKKGDTVFFKCGGKAKLSRLEPSKLNPGNVFITFERQDKFRANYTNNGLLFSYSSPRPVKSVFSIVRIIKRKKK